MYMFELYSTKFGFVVMVLDRFLIYLYLKQCKDQMCCAYTRF